MKVYLLGKLYDSTISSTNSSTNPGYLHQGQDMLRVSFGAGTVNQ